MAFDADWTLYVKDSDPSYNYMYTFPSGSLEKRVIDPETTMPEMFAPLIVDGAKRAWKLIKKAQTTVSEPVRKRDIVKILGADGDFDLLENMTGKATYENRKLTETYLIMADQTDAHDIVISTPSSWNGYISNIKNYLNSSLGKFRIVDSRNKWWYWIGRVTAAVKEMGNYRAILTITADIEPYKYERYHSAEPWIWDDFSFIDGIARDTRDYIKVISGVGSAPNNTATVAIPTRLKKDPMFVRVERAPKDATDTIRIIGQYNENAGTEEDPSYVEQTITCYADCEDHETEIEHNAEERIYVIHNDTYYPVDVIKRSYESDGAHESSYVHIPAGGTEDLPLHTTEYAPFYIKVCPSWEQVDFYRPAETGETADDDGNVKLLSADADGVTDYTKTIPIAAAGTVTTHISTANDNVLFVRNPSAQVMFVVLWVKTAEDDETMQYTILEPIEGQDQDSYVFFVPKGATAIQYRVCNVIEVENEKLALTDGWCKTEYYPAKKWDGSQTDTTIKNDCALPLRVYCKYRGASL